MRPILQPGIRLPEFLLPAANRDRPLGTADLLGQVAVVLFFPFARRAELTGQLAAFQEKQPALTAQQAQVVAITDGEAEALKAWAAEEGLTFPLLSDGQPRGATAARFGTITVEGSVLPAVFVADEEGLIRRVYEPNQEASLPNPALVRRAVVNLSLAPKPPPPHADDWQLGPADAPVVLIEYADYQCGYCQETYRALTELLPAYGNRLRLIYRHFLLRRSHPLAQGAAEAAEAAGAQGRFWPMHERLFAAAGALERDQLVAYARELGLDVARFVADLDSGRFAEKVEEDMRGALAHKIKSPPAVFVNQIVYDGPRTAQGLRTRIDGLLACLEG